MYTVGRNTEKIGEIYDDFRIISPVSMREIFKSLEIPVVWGLNYKLGSAYCLTKAYSIRTVARAKRLGGSKLLNGLNHIGYLHVAIEDGRRVFQVGWLLNNEDGWFYKHADIEKELTQYSDFWLGDNPVIKIED